LLSARDTVATETPARRATSLMLDITFLFKNRDSAGFNMHRCGSVA
jgi:hypothetical protein